jgi:hypothetical protein
MNIPNELRKEQTTQQQLKVSHYVLENESCFKELMDVFLADDYRLQQRSAWIVGHVSIKKPFLLEPYYKSIIERLSLPEISDTFKRNVVRVWQEVALPKVFLGEIYDCCFRFLTGKEAIAIKAFSMTVCHKISQQFPDLKPELLTAIEDVLMKDGRNSKGIMSRGNKTLKLLQKELSLAQL